MVRFVSDQNQIGFFYESGTYGNPTGTALQWIGFAQEHTADDNVNVITTRFLGNASRNIGRFDDGPLDHTGKFSYYPQDWKFFGFALGSIVDSGSPSPYAHTLSETNSNAGNAYTSGVQAPHLSFALEAGQSVGITGSNFVRTYKGCVVDSYTINMSQGDIISCDVDYKAQSVTYASGALSTLTASTLQPYKWNDVKVHLPSGTVINEVKNATFTLNNNFEAPHYLNGSRVIGTPQALNRDYEFSLTMDASNAWYKTLYDQYFLGGSTFNVLLEVNQYATVGSTDLLLSMSGCKMIDMEAPETIEGVNETTLTIAPKTVSAIVNDTIQLYNAW